MSTEKIRAAILAADDLPLQPYKIPEWNFVGMIKPLNGDARFRLSQLVADPKKGENMHLLEAYICEGLADDNGKPIFSIEDRGELAKKNPAIVDRVYRAILEVSKMDSVAEVEAEKKSGRAPN
jgi:hypothetical protein